MATDPIPTQLTPAQQQQLMIIAQKRGKDQSAVLDDLLAEAASHDIRDGRTAYEAFAAAGALGCVKDTPRDLSTNPKYMEGFGTNARSQRDAD